jgi:hypothetical protein
MQTDVDVSNELSLELLFSKSEKIRKTVFAHHAAVTAKLLSTEEQLEWVTQEMMKLKRTIDGC